MNDNNKIHKALCERLDKDVEAVSASVQSRLTRMRVDALAQSPRAKDYTLFGLTVNPMKASAVFASLLFVAFSSFFVLDFSNTYNDETIGELIEASVVNGDVGKEFFLTEEDLDFFENLELYQWLDSEFKMS
jgi:hypothetical protein